MIAQWILYALIVGALVSVAAEAADRALRAVRLPRRWVWVAALLLTTTLPVISIIRASTTPAVTGAVPVSPLAVSLQAATTVVTRASERALRVSLDALLMTAWAVASLVFAARLAHGVRALRQRRRQWRSISVDGVPVRVSDDLGPAVVGLRPMEVVLPNWALALDAPLRAIVLRHEEEHRRAGDPMLLVFSALAIIALPWNAAIWWQARRLRLAIEIDCDARVLGAEPNAERYGLLLLSIAERRAATRTRLATNLLEPVRHLERRIAAMTPDTVAHSRIRASALTALGALALIAACNVDTPPEPPARAAAATADTTAKVLLTESGVVVADSMMLIPRHEYEQLKAAAKTRGVRLPVVERGVVGGRMSQEILVVDSAARALRELRVRVASFDTIDTLRLVALRSAADDLSRTQAAQGTVQVAAYEYQVDQPAQWQAGTGTPRYPPTLKSARVSGSVLAQFVVDTTGRAELDSFRVLRSSHDLFSAAVRNAMLQMRFTPAAVSGGRKVRQLIQQEFRFEVQ